ncbi:hypothetical protein HPB51_009616 [Rhipicephalus microplus]|uniref:Orn/DAP/Arg decarboxylase 2 C-terminal domain-containing protein n=1 Tax=Rhipicephalus microplus TaxID=6941 RepID=A0A9J6DLK5_RHIMP|nr:hypothetical protein HPB51_009616 [Rhipicephalus microplus]
MRRKRRGLAQPKLSELIDKRIRNAPLDERSQISGPHFSHSNYEYNQNIQNIATWEIETVVNSGIDSSRIIYANTAKQSSHLEFAKDIGVCKAVRCALDLHFPESSGVTIIAEPGQYFVTAPYILVAKVVAKRTRQTSIRGALCYHHDVYLNASKENCIPRDMYSFLDITFQPLGPPHDRPRTHLTTLWGATCHPLDVMEESVPFFEVSVDEWLVVDNVGAYGMVKASGFNGIGFPPVHYITSAEEAPRIAELLEASPFTPGYSQLMQAAKTVG